MYDLLVEVERFRAWAANYSLIERSGEWEVEYENWDALYSSVREFLDKRPVNSWSANELTAVLYAIARDNECENISSDILERSDDLLLDLAEASLQHGEADAKWQLASALGHIKTQESRREQLLQTMVQDENEYVRRRALQSLARTASPATEQYALDAWRRMDEAQEYARMNALWALHRIHSPQLASLLLEAEQDRWPHLTAYAAKIRSGEVTR
jgi:HEAT repeat protein